MLKIENLSKKFKEKEILKNISFEIPKGQIAIFLGNSGVGKSTLLRILNNLESYDTGYIYFDNKKINAETINTDNIIGMVFQHFNIFDYFPAYKNITLPLIKGKKKSKNEAVSISDKLLEKYNLLEEKNILAKHLSGGQKQRLALARTLALDPQIICMDEPTSALDPSLTYQIANDIKQIASEGKIIIITTHDTELVKQLDAYLFLLKDGEIVEQTTSKNYYSNPEKFPLIKSFFNAS